MTPEKFKQLLKEFAPKQKINEADIIPIGPDGQQITDQRLIKNLNFALKSVDPTLRTKLTTLITDSEAVKSLKTIEQKAAIVGAIAIAFGINADDFNKLIPKVKKALSSTSTTPNENPEA
jgi:hypothetical protein